MRRDPTDLGSPHSPRPFLCGGKNVELALAEVCTSSCAMARGKLVGAPQAAFSFFFFFQVWLENRKKLQARGQEQGGGREEKPVNTAPETSGRQSLEEKKMLENAGFPELEMILLKEKGN